MLHSTDSLPHGPHGVFVQGRQNSQSKKNILYSSCRVFMRFPRVVSSDANLVAAADKQQKLAVCCVSYLWSEPDPNSFFILCRAQFFQLLTSPVLLNFCHSEKWREFKSSELQPPQLLCVRDTVFFFKLSAVNSSFRFLISAADTKTSLCSLSQSDYFS